MTQEFEEIKYIVYYWEWHDTNVPVIIPEQEDKSGVTSIDDFSFDVDSQTISFAYTQNGEAVSKSIKIQNPECVEDITKLVLNVDDSLELFYKQNGVEKSITTSVEKLEDDMFWDEMNDNNHN